jgi:hypothetical protein
LAKAEKDRDFAAEGSMKRSEIVEHFKDVRVRGTDVLAVPLDEKDMTMSSRENQFGPGVRNLEPEDPIRFVAVAVGPGFSTRDRLIPLGISPGDVFLSNVDNEHLREDWKNRPRVLMGHRILLFVAMDDETECGAIPMVLENVPEVE